MTSRVTRHSANQHRTPTNSDKENAFRPVKAPMMATPKSSHRKSNPKEKASNVPAASKTKPVSLTDRKRKRDPVLEPAQDYEELPHNLGKIPKAGAVKEEDERKEAGQSAQKHRATTKNSVKQEPSNAEVEASVVSLNAEQGGSDKKDITAGTTLQPDNASLGKKRKTTKTNEYGLTPGVSPFSEWPHPTPEECHTVAQLLRGHHPNCHPRPKTIPPPSEIVAGCGEVPSILDALVRTLLSAATTGRNSSSAYQGMVARYGNSKTGVGKGSVDYNAVRLAPQKDLETAIASGGLAHAKSKNIKALLDMVYAENQERKNAHLAARSSDNEDAAPKGADTETKEQADAEIALAEGNILSLDHYYTLPTYDAIFTFVKYPGIGVKTAACVALFCMQRDCFAVDTHVFRLCQWLGWLPPDNKKVSRDTAFSHLEVRIPDELKYDLHQLFITHGKNCPRCRASTGETSAKWEQGCVIDHLVKRTGPRKAGGSSPAKKSTPKAVKTKKGSRKYATSDDDDDDEDVDMPDLSDDEEEEAQGEGTTPGPTDEEEYQAPAKARAAAKKEKSKVAVAPAKGKNAKGTVSKKAAAPKSKAAAKSTSAKKPSGKATRKAKG